MKRALLLLALAALALAPPAHASLVQDLTGLKLQQDAGIAGDAPDSCDLSDRTLYLPFTRSGLIVPIEDPRDVYMLDLTNSAGDSVFLEFFTSPDQNQVDYEELDYYLWQADGPGCGTLIDTATKVGQYDSMEFVVPADGTYFLESVHVAVVPPALCFNETCVLDAKAASIGAHPIEPQERTACAPGCNTVNRLVGYSMTGYKLS